MQQSQLMRFSHLLETSKVYNYAECIVDLAPSIVEEVPNSNQKIVAKLLNMTEPKLSGLLPILQVLATRQDSIDLEVHTSNGIVILESDV